METCFPRFAAFAAWQFLACAHFADAREPLLARGANRALLTPRKLISIPTFGFCRAKNESYTRVF